MDVIVLRIGHRKERDKRVTTHVCLVARALGASGVIITGERDPQIVKSVRKVIANWGGDFKVRLAAGWKSELAKLKKRGYKVIHLTMYGMPLQNHIDRIRSSSKKIAIVVGAEKVPGAIYNLADYNISVTNQPHSEIAALALTLDRLFAGREFNKRFSNARMTIVPQERGKYVIEAKRRAGGKPDRKEKN